MLDVVRIYKSSDWDFEYKLPDSYDWTCPFAIRLYTIDFEDNKYTATYDGNGHFDNCTKTDNNSVIIHIDNFTFYEGCIRIQAEYYVDSVSFDDGIYNDKKVEKTNIYMTNNKSDSTTSVMYEGSSLPNFDVANLDNTVQQALLDIDERLDEIENTVDEVDATHQNVLADLDALDSWMDDIDSMVRRSELDLYVKRNELGPYMTEDETSDWLNDYYTKTEADGRYYTQNQVDHAIEQAVDGIDFEPYATKSWVEDKRYLTRHQDLGNYATREWVLNQPFLTEHQDLTPYDFATKGWVNNQGFLKEHQDLSAYATQNWVRSQNYLKLEDLPEEGGIHVDLEGYAKYADLNLDQYVTESEFNQAGFLTKHQDLTNYATKAWVENQNYLKTHQDLSNYATRAWVEGKNYLTQHQDLSDYATKSYVTTTLSDYATKKYVEDRLDDVVAGQIDLSNYATKSWVEGKNYLTQHQDISHLASRLYVDNAVRNVTVDTSNLVTKSELSGLGYVTQTQLDRAGYITSAGLSNYVTDNELQSHLSDYVTENQLQSHLSDYVTKNDLSNQSYATKDYVDSAIEEAEIGGGGAIDLTQYVKKTELSAQGYITSIPDTYATKSYVADYVATHGGSGGSTPDLSNYVTKNELSNQSYATQSYVVNKINNLEPISYNISIWYGTQAQYDALSNYTTYQLYLIAQE